MTSAGLLMYRRSREGIEVFLVHPGGPFFAGKDAGAWSVPKGIVEPSEDATDPAVLLSTAFREFEEETGQGVDACRRASDLLPLGSARLRSGKIVHVWAFEGEWPAGSELRSNTFEIEFPPRSGRRQEFPEVDRAGFFPLARARVALNPGLVPFLDRLLALAGADAPPAGEA